MSPKTSDYSSIEAKCIRDGQKLSFLNNAELIVISPMKLTTAIANVPSSSSKLTLVRPAIMNLIAAIKVIRHIEQNATTTA